MNLIKLLKRKEKRILIKRKIIKQIQKSERKKILKNSKIDIYCFSNKFSNTLYYKEPYIEPLNS